VLNVAKLLLSVVLLAAGYGLIAVVTGNVIMTFIHTLVLLWMSIKCLPHDFHFEFRLDFVLLKAMLVNGVLVSATNLSSQLMVNIDKILIGAFLPINALSYYVVSYELASRLWYIPNQIMRAHFPTFGYLWGQNNMDLLRYHYRQAVGQVVIGVSFVGIFLVVYSETILRFWVGSSFAESGSRPLQFLALGLMMSCAGTGPYSLMIAIGRANATARIRTIVLTTNVLLCLLLIPRYGIDGAAVAWFISNLVDAILLNWRVDRALFPGTIWWLCRHVLLGAVFFSSIILSGLYVARNVLQGLLSLSILFAAGYCIYLFVSYHVILTKEEQKLIRSIWSGLRLSAR